MRLGQAALELLEFLILARSPPGIFSSGLTVQQLEVQIQPSTDLLNRNIVNLISAIEALTDRINALELGLKEISSPPNEIRRVDDEQARREIKELFDTKHGETIFPSEVAEELHLDYASG